MKDNKGPIEIQLELQNKELHRLRVVYTGIVGLIAAYIVANKPILVDEIGTILTEMDESLKAISDD